MAFEETSRHKSNSNMHTKLANQHFCKIPKNQADLHFIIFDVVVRIMPWYQNMFFQFFYISCILEPETDVPNHVGCKTWIIKTEEFIEFTKWYF